MPGFYVPHKKRHCNFLVQNNTIRSLKLRRMIADIGHTSRILKSRRSPFIVLRGWGYFLSQFSSKIVSKSPLGYAVIPIADVGAVVVGIPASLGRPLLGLILPSVLLLPLLEANFPFAVLSV